MFHQQLDEIDLQHVQELVRTRGFQIVQQIVAKMLEDARTALETADGDVEVNRLQGQCRALREVLRVPEKVTADVKSRRERGKR